LLKDYTLNDKISSQAVSLEAIMMSCAIDEKEGQYDILTDIPGVFLNADMKDKVHRLLEGTICQLIMKL